MSHYNSCCMVSTYKKKQQMNKLFDTLETHECSLVETGCGNYYITWFREEDVYVVVDWDSSSLVMKNITKNDLIQFLVDMKILKVFHIDNKGREIEVL